LGKQTKITEIRTGRLFSLIIPPLSPGAVLLTLNFLLTANGQKPVLRVNKWAIGSRQSHNGQVKRPQTPKAPRGQFCLCLLYTFNVENL